MPYVRKWGAMDEHRELIQSDMDYEENRVALLDVLRETDITLGMFEEVYGYVAKYIDFEKTFRPTDEPDLIIERRYTASEASYIYWAFTTASNTCHFTPCSPFITRSSSQPFVSSSPRSA